LSLCNLLEAMADSLPDHLDRQLCLHIARSIGRIIKHAHATEETLLFPTIIARHGDKGAALIEHLRREQFEDEYFADEVQLALLQAGKGASTLTPEATGYMLRGFFDGIRQHVRHGRELVEMNTPR
jgi:hemerythrin-like domain-containing protein